MLFTLVTILLTPSLSFAAFRDVSSGHLNSDAVEYVRSQGIVGGYEDGTYKPDKTINRAEFTKIVVESKYSREEIDACLSSQFPDVPQGQWFTKYVCMAKGKGIIQGYPDGTFRPAQNISFVEAAKIIVTAQDFSVGTDSVWYKPFVERLGTESAIPTTVDRFEKNITRGEMAEMIYRLKAKIRNKTSKSYNALAGVTSSPSVPVTPSPSVEDDEVKEFVLSAQRFFYKPSTLTVTEGDTVRFVITAKDTAHGFAISEFGVNRVVEAGVTETIEFVADKPGEFKFFCSVYCGAGHSSMKGKLIVEPSEELDVMRWQGQIVAGSSATPLLDFKQADYEAALAANKHIALYFYATWCPLCRNEVAEATYPAFNEFSDPDLVGFRVNYNDGDTDDDEVDLARKFGIAYQHTKVFLKNGERVLKSPEQWSKARYLQEFANLVQ